MALQNRGRSVRRLVAASVLESLGDATARTVGPLVAVSVLGAGTGVVGVLNAAGLVAFLLLGAPLGAAADSARPVRVMTVGSLVRAAAAAVGLAAWRAGRLEGSAGTALLIALALAVGVADVAYTTARGALIPRLVDVAEVRDVYGRVQTASQAGGLIAPLALAGLLAVGALLPVLALTALGVAPAAYALLGIVGAASGLAGAATASALTQRLGLRGARTLGSGCLLLGAVLVAALVLAPAGAHLALPLLAIQSALAGGGVSLMLVAGADLPARLAPPDRLGAVTGAQQAVVVGIMPLAAVAVGAVGAFSLGAAVAAWIACAAATTALSACLDEPVLSTG